MKHVWSLAPSVLCLSQLSGSPHALSWRGAAPSCCCVLQTLRCHVLGWSCHQHPMWPHCASTWGRGREPHPPGGFCQSQIIPVDDLGVWVLDGTAIANGTWGLFLGNPSSCQKQGAQPYLFVLTVLMLPQRGALVPCSVLLEDVLRKSCWLWGSSWFQLEAAAGLFPLPSGASVCLQVPRPLLVCLVTFSHMYCCCLEVLFPWSPRYGVGKQGRNDVVSRVLARTEMVYALY